MHQLRPRCNIYLQNNNVMNTLASDANYHHNYYDVIVGGAKTFNRGRQNHFNQNSNTIPTEFDTECELNNCKVTAKSLRIKNGVLSLGWCNFLSNKYLVPDLCAVSVIGTSAVPHNGKGVVSLSAPVVAT
jgi:hypothetical protein